jgi:dTDP-4-dehydrorhamnose 3,5-epimerase
VSRFEFLATPLAGLLLVQHQLVEDGRGFLSRVYEADVFAAAGMAKPIVHVNHTMTRPRGAVRGMHFQRAPHAEMKLVTCVRGEVFDVSVDLRRRSATFLRWHGEVLSAANHRSVLIPEGFAHGFQVLTDECELLYLHTAPFEQAAEGAVSATDPRVAISWPIPIADMSDRDRHHPLVAADFEGFDL